MFYYLTGKVALLDANLAVIDCGGVGYACHASNYTLSQLRVGEEKRLYKVYRPAAALAMACAKFANLPMTHHHPKTPVDGQNFRDLAIGWTGEHPEVDYIAETNEVGIKSTCMLYDDEALQAYQNGEIQLSPGYIAEFEWQQGKSPDGQEYDIIMKEITDVNHLALLPAGRGGEYAVVMDQQAPQTKNVFQIAAGSVFDRCR